MTRRGPGPIRRNWVKSITRPGPDPHRFPLLIRTSRDEGVTWSAPTVLADRPENVGGWSICYPTLTELPDGTLVAIWAQKKDSTAGLYSDIHSARVMLGD